MFQNKVWIVLALLIIPCVSAHYISGPNEDQYLAQVMFDNTQPSANEPTRLFFVLLNGTNGQPYVNLDAVHERKLHAFLVSADLEHFMHLHPEDNADGFTYANEGTFAVHPNFSVSGPWLAIVDYTVANRNVIRSIPFNVRGSPEQGTVTPNYNRTGTFDGYTVTLIAPEHIKNGTLTMFTYEISKDGVPVTDLDQYLGSALHLLSLKSDLTLPDHTHAYIPGHALHAGSMPQRYVGPRIPVQETFSQPGTYVLFAQFEHQGHVVTTRFFINVEEGKTVPYKPFLWALAIALVCFGALATYRFSVEK